MDLPHVYIEFPSICGTLQTKKWAPGDTVFFFGSYNGPQGPLEDQGRAHFGLEHVLSVSVVLSESVESAMECEMTCEMTCFCAVSLRGLLAKTAFGDNANLELADPCLAHFVEHPTATCPRLVIHAGQKFPQFCGIGRSWMLNKLCPGLVPQEKKSKGESSGATQPSRRSS